MPEEIRLTGNGGVDFFNVFKARLLENKGAIGNSTTTGQPLPALTDVDMLAIGGVMFGFVIEDLQYLADPIHGTHVVHSVHRAKVGELYTAGKGYVEYLDPGATEVQGGKVGSWRWSTRSITEWMRMSRIGQISDEPLRRSYASVSGRTFEYWLWCKGEGNTAKARKIMSEWNALMVATASVMNALPGNFGAVRRLTKSQVQQVWNPFYRLSVAMTSPGGAANRSTIDRLMSLGEDAIGAISGAASDAKDWVAENAPSAAEVKQAIKDGAGYVGEVAGEVADVAGEATGKFGAGFLKQVGIYGLIAVAGLVLLKSRGVI